MHNVHLRTMNLQNRHMFDNNKNFQLIFFVDVIFSSGKEMFFGCVCLLKGYVFLVPNTNQNIQFTD